MSIIIIVVIIALILGFIIGRFIVVENKNLNKQQLKVSIVKILAKHKAIFNQKNVNNNKIVLLLINLDDFHGVVETCGYDISNNIINNIKKKIANYAKKANIIFYYTGYDEYILIYCKKLFDDTQIINEATKVLEVVSSNFVHDNNNIYITASVGISIFPDYTDNADRLLRCAELALVDAKNSGRNTYNFYRQGLIDKAVDRAIIKTELLTAQIGRAHV
jgi:diguanylate cyclase (GGDEF)-like protein